MRRILGAVSVVVVVLAAPFCAAALGAGGEAPQTVTPRKRPKQVSKELQRPKVRAAPTRVRPVTATTTVPTPSGLPRIEGFESPYVGETMTILGRDFGTERGHVSLAVGELSFDLPVEQWGGRAVRVRLSADLRSLEEDGVVNAVIRVRSRRGTGVRELLIFDSKRRRCWWPPPGVERREDMEFDEIYVNLDGDGYDSVPCGGPDCDDYNADRAPGYPERCDPEGLDEDCDSATFHGPAPDGDRDGDGYVDVNCYNLANPFEEGHAAGVRHGGNDCDDSRPDVSPGAPEVCNGRDDNCDGEVDEGLRVAVYRDGDGDTFGNPAVSKRVCFHELTPEWVLNNNDCDDTDPRVNPATGCP